ncbi:hypothetical protein DICA1_E08878 [Diutina catenulata]
MMAHSLPHQIPVHVDDRRLPNGAKVDFGHGAPPKKKKSRKPASDKPTQPQKSEKKSQKSKQQMPNGQKPQFGPDKPKKPAKKSTAMAPSDSYAGGSFHSSPEAVALPKPSFSKSPPKNAVTAYPSGSVPATPHQSTPQASRAPNGAMPMAPNPAMGAYPMMPPMMVPNMPANIQSGFTYQVNPQGYIMYPPQPGAGPAGAVPYVTHFQHPPPYAAPVVPQGQKISFSDLIGSSK